VCVCVCVSVCVCVCVCVWVCACACACVIDILWDCFRRRVAISDCFRRRVANKIVQASYYLDDYDDRFLVHRRQHTPEVYSC